MLAKYRLFNVSNLFPEIVFKPVSVHKTGFQTNQKFLNSANCLQQQKKQKKAIPRCVCSIDCCLGFQKTLLIKLIHR